MLLLAAHRLCDEAEILYYSHGDDTKVRKAAMKAISIFKRIVLPCVPSSITRRQGCSEIDHALDGGMLQVYGRLRVLCHLVTVTIEQGASFDSFEVILDAYSNLSQSNCKEDIDAAKEENQSIDVTREINAIMKIEQAADGGNGAMYEGYDFVGDVTDSTWRWLCGHGKFDEVE